MLLALEEGQLPKSEKQLLVYRTADAVWSLAGNLGHFACCSKDTQRTLFPKSTLMGPFIPGAFFLQPFTTCHHDLF